MRHNEILFTTEETKQAYKHSAPVFNKSLTGVTIQAAVKHEKAGPVASEVVIQASNDGTDFFDLSTITLIGESYASDGFCSNPSWPYYKVYVANVSPQSFVKVTMGLFL